MYGWGPGVHMCENGQKYNANSFCHCSFSLLNCTDRLRVGSKQPKSWFKSEHPGQIWHIFILTLTKPGNAPSCYIIFSSLFMFFLYLLCQKTVLSPSKASSSDRLHNSDRSKCLRPFFWCVTFDVTNSTLTEWCSGSALTETDRKVFTTSRNSSWVLLLLDTLRIFCLLYFCTLNVGLLLLTEYFSTFTSLGERVSIPLLLLGIT